MIGCIHLIRVNGEDLPEFFFSQKKERSHKINYKDNLKNRDSLPSFYTNGYMLVETLSLLLTGRNVHIQRGHDVLPRQHELKKSSSYDVNI